MATCLQELVSKVAAHARDVSNLTATLLLHTHTHVPIHPDALNCVIAIFFVRETQDLTLEQIDTMYLSGVPAWRSRSWVPAGYTSRREVKVDDKEEDNATQVSDPKPEWRSKPDPMTGEETDKARKTPAVRATTEA